MSWQPLHEPAYNRQYGTIDDLSAVLPRYHPNRCSIYMSTCSRCGSYAIWSNGVMVDPARFPVASPHTDMPDNVKELYYEAGFVLDISPRSAAVLLRVALGFMLTDMGEDGGNPGKAIEQLTIKGTLNKATIQAMHVVREIGNSGAHINQIVLTDERKDAEDLFELMNYIADRVYNEIAMQFKTGTTFDSLPVYLKDRIEKRVQDEINKKKGKQT